MKQLVHCCCGLIYGELPEITGAHPRNFCDECARAVRPSECWLEPVSDTDYFYTAKHHYHPNYVDYKD